MTFICAIDQSEHADREALHRHLRKLKIKQEAYYTAYAPSRDKLTGEVIPWKAPAERYCALEFASKDNLRKWIKTDSPEARQWAVEWLRKRKVEKELVYAPSQVELRSLMSPTVHYYNHIGGYNTICRDLGYTDRFSETELARIAPHSTIIQDSREQAPLKLSVPTIKQKLPYGDYGLPPDRDLGVYVERKSISDFYNTLSERRLDRVRTADSNFARFSRELERAHEAGAYIVMLVEVDIETSLAYSDHGAVPEHTFHNLRDLLVRFPTTLQALFVRSREEAAMAVTTLLAAGESVKSVDLQLLYERGGLLPK